MEACWERGVSVRAYDPVAISEARRIYGDREDLIFAESSEEALDGADALVVATEWREFRSPDFDLLARQLKTPVIIDGRNIYDPEKMRQLGFDYYGVGRVL